ncbi:hypothetical protein EVG20_g2387 [Dentipellis fragilis]|uniref:Uncharacterized protein n=1 Tax=Dentipellis fragilis TaxID=205917 RepID=A0A4Y9Z6Y8_9AGAM|nr:hypothetical protein EVG20_g2387 [Dentipellis fragilis]
MYSNTTAESDCQVVDTLVREQPHGVASHLKILHDAGVDEEGKTGRLYFALEVMNSLYSSTKERWDAYIGSGLPTVLLDIISDKSTLVPGNDSDARYCEAILTSISLVADHVQRMDEAVGAGLVKTLIDLAPPMWDALWSRRQMFDVGSPVAGELRDVFSQVSATYLSLCTRRAAALPPPLLATRFGHVVMYVWVTTVNCDQDDEALAILEELSANTSVEDLVAFTEETIINTVGPAALIERFITWLSQSWVHGEHLVACLHCMYLFCCHPAVNSHLGAAGMFDSLCDATRRQRLTGNTVDEWNAIGSFAPYIEATFIRSLEQRSLETINRLDDLLFLLARGTLLGAEFGIMQHLDHWVHLYQHTGGLARVARGQSNNHYFLEKLRAAAQPVWYPTLESLRSQSPATSTVAQAHTRMLDAWAELGASLGFEVPHTDASMDIDRT